MLAKLSMRYSGTTPDYWLDQRSLDEWLLFLDYSEEEIVHQARMLVGVLGMAMSGKKPPTEKKLIVSSAEEAPDREAFYKSPELRRRIIRR